MTRTDFPYVVTLLLALLSWAVAHAVDRLAELPLVKITQTVERQINGSRVTIEFENITSSVNFEHLTVRILGETPENQFTAPRTKVIGGGWDGSASLFSERDGVLLKMPNFHPEWKLELTTDMTGEGAPRIQLESADTPTILEPAGLRTMLVEWELHIIAAFAGVALVFITVWARKQ